MDILVAIIVFLLAWWAVVHLGIGLWNLIWVIVVIALIVWLLRSRRGSGTF